MKVFDFLLALVVVLVCFGNQTLALCLRVLHLDWIVLLVRVVLDKLKCTLPCLSAKRLWLDGWRCWRRGGIT